MATFCVLDVRAINESDTSSTSTRLDGNVKRIGRALGRIWTEAGHNAQAQHPSGMFALQLKTPCKTGIFEKAHV